jgi:COP9 signalosome complex subunit 1
MGHEDLGLFHEKTGDLDKANECFMAMRQDVGTTEQLVNVAKHMVRVALLHRDWNSVSGQVGKLHGITLGDKSEDEALARYVRITRGIVALALGNFEDTARYFLHLEGEPSECESEMVTRSDIAVYGGLCALATFERSALQSKVLDNQNFRSSLEREPYLRKAISFYVSGRFTAALEILESYRTDFMMDMYLQRWVGTLLENIRSKCIVQFVYPYSCVTIDTLRQAFPSRGRDIQEELRDLIRAGTLKARINTIEGLLTAVTPDPRAELQKSALVMAKNYEKQALERIRRMSIIAAGLESKSVKTGAAPTQGHQQTTENWFDEGSMDAMAA